MFERLRRLFGSRQPETVVFFDEQYPHEVRFEHTTSGLRRKTGVNNHAVSVEACPGDRVWLRVSTSFAEISAPLLAEDCRHLATVLQQSSKVAAKYGGPMRDAGFMPACEAGCDQQGGQS
ncbi:hypothetical protein [Ferruginivarius sediminum]|uniref:Uncharacterized protein n=1 Tax=Ferruginivarius sediminum TaxID=2661937 RepID=A0A369T555_9PROT|nr:hypothetical protein [Ferruginivarius sediminum]RDD60471.1 hypothetical protein DRB17_17885 [Ferruginivarius sediminum]